MTIYNIYNVELVSKQKKSAALESLTEAYNLINVKKYDFNSHTQKHMLYKQFVVWSCNGCSIAPPTDYINNPIYQELPDESDYFLTSDKRIYLDLGTIYGSTKEMEKLERINSMLKDMGIFFDRILVCISKRRLDTST